MSTPKVTKPLKSTKTSAEKVSGLKVRAATGESESKASCVRKNRTASNSLYPHPGAKASLNLPNPQRRTRDSYTTQKSDPGRKNPASCPAKQASKCGRQGALQRSQNHQHTTKHSHTGFTVIPPDPKKRLEIQTKAEAELSALEELQLSKAMNYVSIRPRALGGCLSLEEVRMKQQQEMMQIKRKHNQMKESTLARSERAPAHSSPQHHDDHVAL